MEDLADWIVLAAQEKKQEPNYCWNTLLPDELILSIFSFLTEPISLLAACCTCRHWNYLGDQDKIWEILFEIAKTNKLMEYVGAQEAKLLEYYPAKERYIKIFMKGSIDKQSSCKLQLVLEKTEIQDEQTIQGELVATIYEDTLTIGGVFVYMIMAQDLYCPKRQNYPIRRTEWYWQIPEEDPKKSQSKDPNSPSPRLTPLNHNFIFQPHRQKISQYTQIQPHLLHKGTYHWPFLITIPHPLPPSVNLQITPYREFQLFTDSQSISGSINYRITGLIYGVPGGILSRMFSDRLVESRSIIIRSLECREKTVAAWVASHPPKRVNLMLKNGNMSTWLVKLDKQAYSIGEEVTLDVDFSVNSMFHTPQSLSIVLKVGLNNNMNGIYFEVVDKQKYFEVIPKNQLEHKFQIQFKLRESIFERFVGPPYIWPCMELSSVWCLVLNKGVVVPILIVNDKS